MVCKQRDSNYTFQITLPIHKTSYPLHQRIVQLTEITREHPADEVYVTGTFDDWSKSERLDKKGNIFTKKVILPNALEKIYYKFVVDGNWVTDHTAPQENDESGNLNNVLTADRITFIPPITVNIMSGVTADSSTVSLAGKVLLEKITKNDSGTLPGSFPVSPDIFEEENIILTTKAAGPSSPISQNISSKDSPKFNAGNINESNMDRSKEDEKEHKFTISPLPASPGAVNPLSIEPGQKLPDSSTLIPNTLISSVDLGYEKNTKCETSKNQSIISIPVTNLQDENNADRENSSNTAPISILPIRSQSDKNLPSNFLIQSVGSQSTTLDLAAKIPKNNIVKLSDENCRNVDSNSTTTLGEIDKRNSSCILDLRPSDKGTIADHFTTESRHTAASSTSNLTSKPHETHLVSANQLHKSETITSDNTHKDTGFLKKSLEQSKQSSDALMNTGNTPTMINPEKQSVIEAKMEKQTGSSEPNTAPEIPTNTTNAYATQSQIISNLEASNTDQKKNASKSQTQEKTDNLSSINKSNLGNSDPAANVKTDKKKKRSSIFGKLKAKLIYKDKE